jgi:N-acetylglucosaminyldiphosphoundecaprenol N-acetyl-beta-D-mannosaminyltransferase
MSLPEVLAQVSDAIVSRKTCHIVTADASMAVIARSDAELMQIVQQAGLVTPDGAGILWASHFLNTPIPNKVSGVDLVAHLCRLSAEKGWRLYFLGAAPGVAAQAAKQLAESYPGAQIVGTRDGYFQVGDEGDVLSEIKAARPDILLVALGIPKQEKWINKHQNTLGIPIAIGVGGSFDVYSGRVRRAPVYMQKSGLEWLYRLWFNPRKIGKVMTLPQFALLTIRQRLLRAH